jgi:hypothetical protein
VLERLAGALGVDPCELIRAVKVRPCRNPRRYRGQKAMRCRNWPCVRASPSLEGNYNFAARAVGWEYQVDGTAELMRNEIADEA